MMKALTMLAIACALTLQAQQESPNAAPPKAEPAKRPSPPPEVTALNEATRLKEPAKKLAALEKWLESYSDKSMAGTARTQWVGAAVEVYSKDKSALMAVFQKQLRATVKVSDQFQLQQTLASSLMRKNVFLDEAIKAAKKAQALLKFQAFAREMKEGAERNKRPAPTEGQLLSRYNSQRADLLDTLGQAQWKAGKAGAANRTLKKALALNPSLGASALTLAAIAEKRHKPKEALQYATTAMLARPSPDAKKRLEESYKKRHGGSLDGLETYLDESYQRSFPPPLHLAKYEPAPKRTTRTVLAEVHTGSGCPPCVAADLAFDALMERYNRRELVVLMYHQHIPRPDPMTNNDTRERWKFVRGSGVPTFIVDGKLDGGGGPRSVTKETMERIEKLIAPRLETEAGAALAVEALTDGQTVRVAARVGDLKRKPEGLQLRVALVERMVKYSGENGVRYHPNVVRSLTSLPVTGDGPLQITFDLAAVEARLVEHIRDFEKKDERHNPDGTFRFMGYVHTLDPANLAIVAYLEDEKTKEVFQSAWTEVGKSAEVRISRREQ